MKKIIALACVLFLAATGSVAAQDKTGFFPTPNQLSVCDPSQGLAPCTPLKVIKAVAAAVTPAVVNTIVCAVQSFTVTGVLAGDYVMLVGFTATGNAVAPAGASVTATNTVGQYFCNPTAGNLTPAAGTYTYLVLRPGP